MFEFEPSLVEDVPGLPTWEDDKKKAIEILQPVVGMLDVDQLGELAFRGTLAIRKKARENLIQAVSDTLESPPVQVERQNRLAVVFDKTVNLAKNPFVNGSVISTAVLDSLCLFISVPVNPDANVVGALAATTVMGITWGVAYGVCVMDRIDRERNALSLSPVSRILKVQPTS